METTLDGLLDRRVTIKQPAKGYRVAIDTVLLASAVPVQAGEAALDLGCGVGGAMLCLARRVPGISATGLDIDEELIALCRANIARNEFSGLAAEQGDATALPQKFSAAFDHVLMNPPYHEESRHDVSDNKQKRAANTEKDGDLALWITSAAQALKAGGTLTLIHRADRAKDILALLAKDFGVFETLALLPKKGSPPKRIIVRARKGASGTAKSAELILHAEDGRYTGEAESILRHAKAIDFI